MAFRAVWRTYWRNILLAFIALLAVTLSFDTGRRAGMSDGRIEPSWRYRIYAAPIVLSQIYYGRPYDYTAYQKLAIRFQGETPSIDELIATSTAIPDVASAGLFLILADDKGVVDFTRLAFLLYGLKTSSLYYMYFTIVLGSCLLYVVCYFPDAHKLGLLVFLCVAFYAAMLAFLAFPPGLNVLDVHAFGMLSIVAFLHAMVASTDPQSTRPRQLLTTIGQAIVLVFVCHSRASTITQVLTVAAAAPLVLFLEQRRNPAAVPSRRFAERVFGPDYVRRIVPAAIVLLAIALLPLYQRLVYNRDYFGRRATLNHIVYHNLLIGLQWNPVLKDAYGLGSGDLGAARAVDAFLEKTNSYPGRHAWAATNLNSVTTQMPFDWVEYEEAARELYFTIWKERTRESLLTLLYYHPMDIYTVAQIQRGAIADPRFNPQYAYNPFRSICLLAFAAATVLCTGGRRPIPPIYALLSGLAFASALVVPILVYGGFIILAEAFVSAGLLIYTTLGVVLSWLIVQAVHRLRARAMVQTA